MAAECRWTAAAVVLRALGVALQILIAASASAHDPGRNSERQLDRSVAGRIDHWGQHITEASARFGIPEDWIRRVMRAESGGRTILNGRPITSRAGAMGLMQLMPGTWAEMRAVHRLGPDPHDPRDNILAGTAYLRRLCERFGYPGLFAAYNAGPSRYADHLATGRPLPAETIAYVAAINGASARVAAAPRRSVPSLPQAGPSGLFVALLGNSGASRGPAASDAPSAIFVPLGTASSPSP